MNLLIDLHYFGSVNYYSTLIKYSYVKFDLYVPWQKQGFLNRCTLASANGPLKLSVPVIGGRDQKSPFGDVRICYREDWQANHYKSMVSAYNRSPYFSHYQSVLEDLYSRKYEYIWEWDLECFKWSISALNSNIEFKLYDAAFEENDKQLLVSLVDERGKFNPRHPIDSSGHTPVYPQVFEDRLGFIPNLSILDLLFCMGPQALNILKGS